MPPAAKTQVTWFALFNLIAAPLIGRGVWALMLGLNTDRFRLMAVLVSVAGAVAILGVNAWLTRRATLAGLPRGGQIALWLITGGTFALTIGFGVFSPVNLLLALLWSTGP
ncbi:MAG TPA: hypothetical protein VMM59_08580 [Thermohalobaculum sp.]|nr:hypothetical protein [Thermohalobaculum sp.]